MKGALVGSAALLMTVVVQATAVVVMRTPERVVLAADSYATSQDATGRVTTSLACKVRPAGRWWTTVAGYMGVDGRTDLHDRVVDATRAASTLDGVRHVLTTQVAPRMRADLGRARASRGFALFEQGAPVSQIVVADATLHVGVFFTTLTSVEPFALTTRWVACPGPECGDGTLFLGASVDGPVRTLTRRPRPAWVERADAAAARRLIAEQIAATPERVGGPVDVLELTASGARWIARDPKSLCPRLP